MFIQFTKHSLLADSKWIDAVQFGSYNIKVIENTLLISNINAQNKGDYGCQAQNGIEPQLWTKFNVQVLGMLLAVKETILCNQI
jgi:immunoglobulin I-set domain